MDITYDEFMNVQLERLSQRYKDVIKIERLNGINNNESTQFRIYFKKYTEIITMTPNRKPHDTTFKLVSIRS
jgi:hypothetical protein